MRASHFLLVTSYYLCDDIITKLLSENCYFPFPLHQIKTLENSLENDLLESFSKFADGHSFHRIFK